MLTKGPCKTKQAKSNHHWGKLKTDLIFTSKSSRPRKRQYQIFLEMGIKGKSGAKIKKIGENFNKKTIGSFSWHSYGYSISLCYFPSPTIAEHQKDWNRVSTWGKVNRRSGCEYWSENSWIKLTTTWLPDC